MSIGPALTLIGLLASISASVTMPSSAGAAGTPAVRFEATITGNIRDSGGVTSTETVLQQQPPEFNGCAIIKHKHTELGQYTLEVRVNRASFLLGGWEKGAVDFSIADYRPNISIYTSPSFGGKFAFKGHAYGASVTYSRVQVRDGGRSGTYTDTRAFKLVPGTANALTSAGTLTFRATWNCASVFHLSDS
jgi:hypothetical protein